MSNFHKDKQASDNISTYLDEYAYPHIFPGQKPIREFDVTKQKQGIDVTIGSIVIDEKAAIYYANKNLSTFAFELVYGDDRQGWLFNPDYQTTHYMLIYLDKVEGNVFENPVFRQMSLLLINRKRLIEYIDTELGISKDNVTEYVERARKAYSIPLAHGAKIRCSNQLRERPVNIIIPKPQLEKLATKKAQLCESSS